jgi:hypothetical protein
MRLTWPRHQHGQPAQELHRVEHDVGRPIGPRLPPRDAHLTVGRHGEPLGRDGRPEHVAADPLEPIALPRRDDEPRMQVHPVPPRMARAQWAIDRRTRVPETTDARPGVTPERDEPLHRRGRQARERRRPVCPRIHPAILGVAPTITLRELSAIEQPPDPRFHGRQDLRHVQRRQTPRRMEPDRTGGILREHAVEHQGVDVDIEIERHPPKRWMTATAPPRGCSRPTAPAWSRSTRKTARRKTGVTRRHKACPTRAGTAPGAAGSGPTVARGRPG